MVRITEDARAVKIWASVLFGFVCAQMVLCIFNFLMLLINVKEAKKKLIKISTIRICISLFFTLVCGLSLTFLFLSSSSKDLKYLSVNACSDDPIMNASFVTMHTYFEGLMVNNILTSLIFLAIVGLQFGFGMLHWYCKTTKAKRD